MEVVRLDELVEVDAQELHCDAEMATEVEVLVHLDDVVLLLRVLSQRSAYFLKTRHRLNTYPFLQVFQDLDLHQGLVMETLLVADDLDRHRLTSAVVTTVEYLSEGALAKSVDNLIAVR